jgi:hypothetical protein
MFKFFLDIFTTLKLPWNQYVSNKLKSMLTALGINIRCCCGNCQCSQLARGQTGNYGPDEDGGRQQHSY